MNQPALHARVLPALRELTHDESDWVRVSALAALATLADSSALEIYEQALDDPARNVREVAIGILASIKRDQLLNELLDYLQDESYSTRAVAIAGLSLIQDSTAVQDTVIPAVYEAMRRDQEQVVRVRAAFTLLEILGTHNYNRRASLSISTI